MAWALRIAVRNAAAVFGYFFSQVAVTMYPLMGMFWVVPWLASASGTAPIDSSSWVTNGSGSHAASTCVVVSALAMSGNGTGDELLRLDRAPRCRRAPS